ncbi:MAG: GTP pyrophosphokinase family protein [Streptococcaceae bacterium]|jgi:putative GTP pyrophosphokinase|nr:GTP pyrophosphokinase family protein [Streptococcaceae bacterium]
MDRNWELFLDPYVQAVGELKVKLRGVRKQYHKQNLISPIEFVTGRVKPVESILKKSEIRGVNIEKVEEEMQDIAGLRVMVQFIEDIQIVVGLLRQRKDFSIVEERDYISNKKKSGYRSYHVVIKYPVQTIEGQKDILAEIQIRTLAMNFWATIEHSLNYKYKGEFPEEIKYRLETSAEISAQLDEEMSQIREEILEAQKLYEPIRQKELKDAVGNVDDND